MKGIFAKNYLGVRLFAGVTAAFLAFAPLQTFAASDTEPATETTTEQTAEQPTGTEEGQDSAPAGTQDPVGMSESEFGGFVEIPNPSLDKGTEQFFDTVGGKILGILLKLLSVGMLLTCVGDLVFIAVPFTQGAFLAAERAGVPLVSNEAHRAAGVPREQPMNKQGQRGGGYGGGYGGGGYGGGYGGGGYGGGYGGGMGGQQGQQQDDGGGIKAYIRSSFVRLILVTAFAVFMLSGVYIHVGYALGNGFSSMLGRI